MIIKHLTQEHRNIEKLLLVLEQELNVFDRGERPDYEVFWAVIAYFQVYPEVYHHPQEDLVFQKLKACEPALAAKIGDLAAEHQSGASCLRRAAHAIETVLMDQEVPRLRVDSAVREFIMNQRRHIAMEESEFFPAAVKALKAQDWAEIGSAGLTGKDPLFDEAAEMRFEIVRKHILQLEQDAEAQRA